MPLTHCPVNYQYLSSGSVTTTNISIVTSTDYDSAERGQGVFIDDFSMAGLEYIKGLAVLVFIRLYLRECTRRLWNKTWLLRDRIMKRPVLDSEVYTAHLSCNSCANDICTPVCSLKVPSERLLLLGEPRNPRSTLLIMGHTCIEFLVLTLIRVLIPGEF
ncbi:uncharacterized protein ARMOST_08642 [Armillaria ostoyae]|uniref:Uncharacterized protein n=1 Tax=Armillaria ostoyae TaxID=47428 RepID=A0A284R995_ARMOS|nr:uncharacterized protein ARMOST_08642 [Armillaria ostoyae]